MLVKWLILQASFVLRLWLILLFLPWASAQAEVSQLKIAVPGFSGAQREAFVQLAHNFQRENEDVYVRFMLTPDEFFKQELDTWLSDNSKFDMVVWHTGERLYRLVRKGLVSPVSDLWENNRYDNLFPSAIKASSSYEGEVYGVPISTYNWGIYYNKRLFAEQGIAVPNTWAELLDAAAALKAKGIVPFTLASDSEWPVGSWYEYLNLRINGWQAQQQLVQANVPVAQTGAQAVLLAWKELLDKDYFIKHHRMISWKSSLPDLYRGRVAMTLQGNFIESIIPESVAEDIGYFRFPTITPNMPVTEVAPTDIIFIANNSENKAAAKRFADYLAQADNQSFLNKALRQLPVNQQASQNSDSNLVRTGLKVLQDADHLTQFFDRETPQALSAAYLGIWTDFIDHRDVEKALAAMESARQNYRSRQAKILVHFARTSDDPYRNQYHQDLVEFLLRKIDKSYDITVSDDIQSQPEIIHNLIHNQSKVNLHWMGTSEGLEKDLVPVRFPTLRGLLGQRVLIINKQDEARFAKVQGLEDLKQLVGGQGVGWIDTAILQQAGLPQISAAYASLFDMLNEGKDINYFSRSIAEVTIEMHSRKQSHPNLMVDQNLLIQYPLALFLFTNKQNAQLAKLLEAAFFKAYYDGSFTRFFYEHPMIKTIFAENSLRDRTVIAIPNALLSNSTADIPQQYWHQNF